MLARAVATRVNTGTVPFVTDGNGDAKDLFTVLETVNAWGIAEVNGSGIFREGALFRGGLGSDPRPGEPLGNCRAATPVGQLYSGRRPPSASSWARWLVTYRTEIAWL